MRLKTVIAICLLGSLFVGCGGDDDKKGGGSGSFADVSDSIENPTGTLEAGNAKAVAEEFSKISSVSFSGERIAQSGSGEQPCPGGGKVFVSAEGSQTESTVVFSYDNCCGYTAGCCFNGDGTIFTSSGSTSTYSSCMDYSIALTCTNELGNFSMDYSGCIGPQGTIYVVELAGETFAVSGYYSNGNGTLNITGANGSFSCTYTNGSGSCTGDSGTITF